MNVKSTYQPTLNIQKLAVLGAGESGVGTAILAKDKGIEVWVSDAGRISEKYKKILEREEIAFEENGHDTNKILTCDCVVKSPGIPDQAGIIQQINAAGIPIISEMEFGIRFTTSKIVGITGSNGKTTTTSLVFHLLKNAGLDVGLGGNIGNSFAYMVARAPHSIYVLEISSFQLDDSYTFRPHVGIITNITPDHLDRYDYKFENYIKSKFKLTQAQTKADFLILDFDDETTVEWIKKQKIQAEIIPFSVEKKLQKGAFINEQRMKFNTNEESFEIELNEVPMPGIHNVKNTMAAVSAAKLLGIRKQAIRESLASFQGVPHRMENLGKIKDVKFINDSKATNVNAVLYALSSVQSPVVWIVGGVDKGNDYQSLMPLVREKVKAIVCLGIDNTKIIHAYADVVDQMVEVQNMKDAVHAAMHLSEKNDTVLLSPACASFDLFKDYQDRGDQFRNEVLKLA